MPEQEYEFQVEIGGTNYGMDRLSSVTITHPLFDRFDVGLCCCARMIVTYRFNMEPPKGAKLIPMYRPKGSNDAWKQIGVFYIDLRTEKADKKTLTCYDSMMKADVQFTKDNELVEDWPRSMSQLANEIAVRMGIALDPRTVLSSDYIVDYPNDLTMRDLLGYIAAAHAGNWIITDEAKLLLVPVATSMPPETNYLVTESGAPIVIGGYKILV